MRQHDPVSYLDRIFDVAIYGSGYAAYAAATSLHASGRGVLLFNRQPDVLWESGRCFSLETGESGTTAWREFLSPRVQRAGVAADGRIDGAISEVLASVYLRQQELPMLFYVAPLAAQMADGALEAVILGTKSGLRRLMARQWIDASETGELLALIDPSRGVRRPRSLVWRAFYQHHAWRQTGEMELPAVGGAQSLHWNDGLWPGERCLTVCLPGDMERPRSTIIPALESLRAAVPGVMEGSVLTHCSVEALPQYAAAPDVAAFMPANNVAAAVPAMSAEATATLADRFALGLAAAAKLADCEVHEPARRSSKDGLAVVPEVRERIECDVVVAGAGTGGALAAVAAGRGGARVVCIDPLAFAGGVGTGGGIHLYYFGVNGGLQEEVDQRVARLMPLFGGKGQVRGFHPEAKKLVLEQMLDEAHVRFMPHTMLCTVATTGRRVTSAVAVGAGGPLELHAGGWIDSTGEGELCVMAGAEAAPLGREVDGGLHAYSQSSGRTEVTERGVRMVIVNYDAGWVDPTDSQDLSRAHLVGVSQYLCDPWTPTYAWNDRPTYIAPSIGIRQGRQVITDYTLTLADLVERRQFPDAVGLTAGHYDTHGVDHEFEGDEAVFWMWVCRQWSGRTACQMPYRMLLPRDLENVWLACRAFGASRDAQFSCRMQRDIQRAGEVAGIAAALAAKAGTGARGVVLAELQEQLAASGAIDLRTAKTEYDFGPGTETGAFREAGDESLKEGLEDLRRGRPSGRLWYVYRAGVPVRPQVIEALSSPDPMSSWLAAAILAMWGDSGAEPRLLQAIDDREYGFANVPEKDRPERNRSVVPHWLVAVTLLRICGTARCVPTLASAAGDPRLTLHARAAIALTIARLARRGVVRDGQSALELLETLLLEPVAGRFVTPSHSPAQGEPGDETGNKHPTAEDHLWQLHVAIAAARVALGFAVQAAAEPYSVDERRLVRSAFARLQPQESVAQVPA